MLYALTIAYFTAVLTSGYGSDSCYLFQSIRKKGKNGLCTWKK